MARKYTKYPHIAGENPLFSERGVSREAAKTRRGRCGTNGKNGTIGTIGTSGATGTNVTWNRGGLLRQNAERGTAFGLPAAMRDRRGD